MSTQEEPLLSLRDVVVSYFGRDGQVNAVRRVSLDLHRNETLGLVGESGCGKSTLARAILRHLGPTGRIVGGEIRFNGQDLAQLTNRQMEDLRGHKMALVHQDPRNALNPSIIVGEQIAEVLRRHLRLSRAQAWARSLDLLDQVHLPDVAQVARRYPHQLSGGMQQRVVICIALACNPSLLIMDEPTTGLDVTIEARVLDLIAELREQVDAGILYITHNLGVVARICQRVTVMYAGQVVESGRLHDLFERPAHPYAAGLLRCLPRIAGATNGAARLTPIPGQVPSLTDLPPACLYEPRCEFAQPVCNTTEPALEAAAEGHLAACHFRAEVQAGTAELTQPRPPAPPARTEAAPAGERLLSIAGLRKRFGRLQRRFIFFGPVTQRPVHAIAGVDLEVRRGETFSLVGESGSGKTTLGRCVVGLEKATEGEMRLEDQVVSGLAQRRPAQLRRDLQIVFQNPHASLNPRHTIEQTIGRPLELHHGLRGDEQRQRILELLSAVRLGDSYLQRRPRQLSGGEKQRVALARTLAGDPRLIVCDEIVSALDVSVQAAILNLLADLQDQRGYAYLFIAHDLSVVRHLSHRVGVIYLGHLVEIGDTQQVFEPPSHPYTEALLASAPVPDPNVRQKNVRLEGSPPSPTETHRGCPFHTRCHRKVGPVCEEEIPPWQESGAGHRIWCHIPLEELAQVGALSAF